jgi:hypothetical protein
VGERGGSGAPEMGRRSPFRPIRQRLEVALLSAIGFLARRVPFNAAGAMGAALATSRTSRSCAGGGSPSRTSPARSAIRWTACLPGGAPFAQLGRSC